jgi:hypothetical protein
MCNNIQKISFVKPLACQQVVAMPAGFAINSPDSIEEKL